VSILSALSGLCGFHHYSVLTPSAFLQDYTDITEFDDVAFWPS
jgi:hypothetical protein